MKPRQFIGLALLGLLLGAGAGLTYKWWQARQAELALPSSGQLPDFTLDNIDGTPWRSEEWRDRVLVVNFWATWCPPCRREMPLFVRLSEEFAPRGVLFVGIAIDDPEKVRNFIDTHGIEFPILLGQEKGIQLAHQLGDLVEGLPYTVVTDRHGRIVMQRMGEVTETALRPLLEKLTAGH